MLDSNLAGRLCPGDYIGIWTFNEDVYTDRFPWRTWSPATSKTTTESILGFLSRQRYEKKTDLDKALTKAFSVIPQSPAMTLVMFSDGDQPMRGTPFDDAINAAFREQRTEQQRTRMPSVAVLRAEKGTFVNYAVGQPPWPIDIPALPGEQRALAEINPAATKPMTPGERAPSAPAKPPAVVSQPTSEKPLAAKVESAPIATGKPVATEPESKPGDGVAVGPVPAKPQPPSDPKPTIVEKSPPAKPALEKAAAPMVEPLKPPTVEVVNSEAVPAPSRKTESPVLALAEPGTPAKPASPTPTPATVAAEASPKPVPPPEAGKVWPVAEPAPKATTTAPALTPPSVSPPKPAEVQTTPPGQTQAAVAENSKPAAAAAQPLPEPPPLDNSSTTPSAEVNAPVQTALALAPQPILSGHRLLVAGLLLLCVAAGLLWLIVRRTRAAATASSLITQSFDRDKDGPTAR